jgi:hypothetical protein
VESETHIDIKPALHLPKNLKDHILTDQRLSQHQKFVLFTLYYLDSKKKTSKRISTTLSATNIFGLTTTPYPSIFAPCDMEPACQPESVLRRFISLTEHSERSNTGKSHSPVFLTTVNH